jgi:predicted ATPase/DNA-binding SARP family transcriptional activator
MGSVQVSVLGPLQVEDETGTAAAPRGERPRDVLAVLVARRGRPVPAETVHDLVWGDAEVAPAAVHTVVARLRRQFGAGLVLTTDAGYLVPSDVLVDADPFAELVSAASGDEVSRRREALEMWSGGTAYAGVRGDLVTIERVRLEELRNRARRDLAAALMRPEATDAEVAEALGISHELIAEQPLDEAAAVLAMHAADRLGRPGEALQVFASLRGRLREELGVDPGATASALHQQLLARDADSAAAFVEEERRVLPGRVLPAPTSPTIGRANEVARILDELRGSRRLITVTGPGGVGKSRLLADIGSALSGVSETVYVALSDHSARTPQDLAAGLALATGVRLADGDAVAGLVRSLRSTEVTILVDEAEWVLGPAAELAQAVLADCPGVRLVVTSRIPLGVVGERLVALAPLPVPDLLDSAEAIWAAPAVRLLAERLADRGALPSGSAADGTWSFEELAVLAEVARRVDGLPLALELVAGQAATMPIAELLDVVDRPLDLGSAEVGRDERQQSLRQTISWSAERLEPAARDAFRRLSVFAGSFTLPAARAVLAADTSGADRVVAELAAYHLVTVDRSAGGLAFRMLRTVRDLAREELASSGQLDATRSRHADWFAGLRKGARLSDELIEDVGRTYDDHLDAMEFLIEVDRPDSAADIGLGLFRFWLFVQSPGPGLQWLDRLLALEGLALSQWARLQVARGGLHHRLDWAEPQHAEVAAALADDPEWTCLLGLMSVITAYSQGDVDGARTHLERCQRVATAGARHHLPEIIAIRAVLDATDGRLVEAVAGAREALAWVGVRASAVDLVVVVPKVAMALLDAGEAREALELLTRAEVEARARFGLRSSGTMAVNTGWAAIAAAEPLEAMTRFAQALEGPHALVDAGGVGEAAVGAATAMVALDLPGSADVAGQGQWLLAQDGYFLPPSLAARVSDAVDKVGSTRPPQGWTPELAIARVSQLIHAALVAALEHAPPTIGRWTTRP